MEEKLILRKRVLPIIRAAIYGAAFFDGMIVVNNWAYHVLGHGSGLLTDLVNCFGWLVMAPTLILSRGGNVLNSYLVNGIIGASLFSLIAAFWQFIVKKDEN